MDADNPMIFCTEKQLAWDAWQRAYGPGPDGAGAQEQSFETWWQEHAERDTFFSPARSGPA